MSTSELACTYAALILADDEIPATADKINAIISAAGVTIEPFWPPLFAKFLEGKSAVDLVSSIGSGGGGAPAAGGAAPAAGAAAAAAPEPEPEEEEEDMGFDLFD